MIIEDEINAEEGEWVLLNLSSDGSSSDWEVLSSDEEDSFEDCTPVYPIIEERSLSPTLGDSATNSELWVNVLDDEPGSETSTSLIALQRKKSEKKKKRQKRKEEREKALALQTGQPHRALLVRAGLIKETVSRDIVHSQQQKAKKKPERKFSGKTTAQQRLTPKSVWKQQNSRQTFSSARKI